MRPNWKKKIYIWRAYSKMWISEKSFPNSYLEQSCIKSKSHKPHELPPLYNKEKNISVWGDGGRINMKNSNLFTEIVSLKS